MTKAPTKREMFDRIFAILTDLGNTEEAEFVAKQINLLDRKRNAPKAMTETQRANVVLKQRLFGRINDADEPMRAGDLAKAEDITNQKATALLTQLVKEGFIVRIVDGKVTTFGRKE